MSLDQRVPPDSFVYGEVVRLYRIAQSLRPTAIDRWTGELYATRADTWGGLHPKTGVFKLSADRVLPYLTGAVSPTERRRQAQALATVLHEATHGAMLLDAPTEPNAVRTMHSYGLTEGFAEVRAFADFELFVRRAGYGGLTLGDPQYPGAYAAARDLMAHITGPSCPQNTLIDKVCQGPGVMHFDQFAHAVVANQLNELTHRDRPTQQAVRAQLIEPMLHNYWPTLPGASAATGQMVAREIRSDLDAKVDELRRHYRLTVPRQVGGPSPASERRPASSAARQDTLDGLRFLASQPSPTGAITHRPQLGQGTRHATPTVNPHTRPSHTPLRD
ncbi:hypothetical protein AB0L64_11270 [Kribbella sp. NPDC051936]|uniref:hypothetical protein n=1 Tax=Kribbella sp. NPDC051936 TaxID=3154946 RepID=UPI00341DBE66